MASIFSGGADATPVSADNDPLFFKSSRDNENVNYNVKSGVGFQKDGSKIHAFTYDCQPNDYVKNKFGAKIEEEIKKVKTAEGSKIEEEIEKVKTAEDSKIIAAKYDLQTILVIAYEDLEASGTNDMPSFLYLAESSKYAITEEVKNKIENLQYDGGVCLALVTELIKTEKDLLVAAVEERPDEDLSPVAALNELYINKVYAYVTSFNETIGVLLNHGVDRDWHWVQELNKKAPTLDKLAQLDFKELQATLKPDTENPSLNNQIANDPHQDVVHQLFTGQIGSPSAGPASTVPPTRTFLADNGATLDFISKIEEKMREGSKGINDNVDLASMDENTVFSMVSSLCDDMGLKDRDKQARLHNIVMKAKEDDVRNIGKPVLGRKRRDRRMHGGQKMKIQKVMNQAVQKIGSKAMTGVAQKAMSSAVAKGLLSTGAKGLMGAGASGLMGAVGAGAAGTGAAGLMGAMGGPVGLALAALPMLIENGEAQKAIAQEMIDSTRAANESAIEENRNQLQEVELNMEHSEADATVRNAMASVEKDPSLQLSTLQGMGLTRLAEALAPEFSPSTMSAIKQYKTDAALVAAVDSGKILRATSFFTDEVDITTSPREKFLDVPKYVDMMGASIPFTTYVHRSTSEKETNKFVTTATQTSKKVADKSTTTSSRTTEAGGNNWVASVKKETTNTETETNEREQTKVNSTESKKKKQDKVKRVFVTEFTYMPVKSVRLNTGGLLLSEYALHQLHKITNINTKEFPDKEAQETKKRSNANQYLKEFGTHIPYGTQTLGGVFIRKMELTSTEEKESTELYNSAFEQLSQTKKNSKTSKKSESGSTGFLGAGVSAGSSSSFSDASSSGYTNTNQSTDSEGNASQKRNESYSCTVTCMGPSAADRDTMYQQLMNNNGTWAVIDRGEVDNYLPIWGVIDMYGQGTHYKDEVKLLKEQWEEMALTHETHDNQNLVALYRDIMPNYDTKHIMFNFVEMLTKCYVPLDFNDPSGTFKTVVERAAKAQVDGLYNDPSGFIKNGFGDGKQTFNLSEGTRHWEGARRFMQRLLPHNWIHCVVYQHHQDEILHRAKPHFLTDLCREAKQEYDHYLKNEKEESCKTNVDEFRQYEERMQQRAMDYANPLWKSIEKIIDRKDADLKVWLSTQDVNKKYPLNYALYSGNQDLVKKIYDFYPDAWQGSVPKPLNYVGYVTLEKFLDKKAGFDNIHNMDEAERLALEKEKREKEELDQIYEAQKKKERLEKEKEQLKREEKEKMEKEKADQRKEMERLEKEERRNREQWLVDGSNWWTLDYAIIFKGKQCWKWSLVDHKVIDGPLALPHPSLPDKIDAILVPDRYSIGHSTKDVAYCFKGNRVWQFSLNEWKVTSGYPKKISDDFPGIPDNIDACFGFYASGHCCFGGKYNGSAFFFKGSEFWRFDLRMWKVVSGYPEQISERWPGLPNDIGSILVYDPSVASGYPTWTRNQAYFFKGNEYWKFNLHDWKTVSKSDEFVGIPRLGLMGNAGLGLKSPEMISDGFSGTPNDVDAFLALGNRN